MMTSEDPRLITNGNCWLTEFDDDNHHRTWEHNAVAARWTPETGWVYPT